MLGSELRRLYLEFFESKGALRLPSDSLVPDDPTLLFTSAGMVQFKPYFLGTQTAPRNSVATAQKCLRTTDIEDVGDTSHCTFFEMLGNFSFGDYFKPEAISWAWEFIFDVLKLDLGRIRVTVFETDDEAFDLWRKVGMPENKIFRFDEHSNYWPAGVISKGPNGPCGPCSEIFFDTQPHLPPTPDGVWDDKRWLEIWNLVFTQYDRGDGGTLTPLPKKNIDTGMGLERTAAAIANLRGPFETDLFAPILRKLEELSGKTYGGTDDGKLDIAFRRIADHVRATAFCLADGVLPSNVGRGYVLRRIMRRAVLAGRTTLGLEKPFLTEIMPVITEQRKGDYPDLEAKLETILRYAAIEEKQFRRTLESGSARLNALLESEHTKTTRTLSGEDVFSLFTTYGFPVELTTELASEHGLQVDQARYEELWEQHLKISEGGKEREVFIDSVIPELRQQEHKTTLFVGYNETLTQAVVQAIVKDGALVSSASEGESVQIVLDQTPFYAESGGQIGDSGWLRGEDGAFDVADTRKDSSYWFHHGVVSHGEIKVGERLDARIDDGRRANIERNHTTTHLLQKALKVVLGDHVQQRGSLVGPDRLRFDFSHDQGMKPEEIREVEALVNEKIMDDIEVRTFEKPIEEAKNMGAMMLFGEKYGDIVRVVQAGDYSVEFCGGTHLKHTSQAGLFKIVSESSSQAGVRRIEAVTGKSALVRTLDQERLLSDAASLLKTQPMNVIASLEKLQAQLKDRERELAVLQKAAAGNQVDGLIEGAKSVDGFRLVSAQVSGADGETLRTLVEEILNRLQSGVVILGSGEGDKVSLAVKVSKDLVGRGVHAGNIVREAAKIVGGGGGGRPDFAQAGGKDPSKLAEALATAERLALEAAAA
ncbi:alanine--tRNA ligase [Capsulimonas corticalis]|uniref:Alanine--tRNA ligase n=1 Tax=Capsulimonas corticalis TaxID=2219043 RepID=A0A402CPE9_9BACT|nr:alanine--tRNA ligase [Capsulimonas corticalis]BDI32982.1 alanine--tRNA ligase [Capsulimonas corticalis]